MTSDTITVNSISRMFRQIPHSMPNKAYQARTFAECLKSTYESENSLSGVDRQMDVSEYRQMISERIQKMPYHSSNDLDTTMISISDAGIERMMKNPEYETWVIKQIQGVFSWNDPFRGMAGGKLNIIRVGETEEDLKITTDRAGFPNGQDSMIPKTSDDDDENFWIRRKNKFEEWVEQAHEMQLEKENGDVPTFSIFMDIFKSAMAE